MRDSISRLPVSARPFSIPIAPVAAVRLVCGALGLALVLLTFRIAAQL